MCKWIGLWPCSERYQNDPQGFSYEVVFEENRPLVVTKTRRVGERVLRSRRYAIAAMAEEGNNLIVDDVLLGSENKEYADLLSPFDIRASGGSGNLGW
jgi:chloramphenicol 3-O phosphotransferase